MLVAVDEIVGGDGLQIGEVDRRAWTQGGNLRVELGVAHVKIVALDQALDVELFEPRLLCAQLLGDDLRISVVLARELFDVGEVFLQLKLE